MQNLQVQLKFQVPEDYVIIKKVELEELKRNELEGKYWTMRDLENRINRKQEGIKENVLYPSEFKEILNVENGGFVYYPKARGQLWSFQATKMAKFLENHFIDIFS
ncbi:Prophage pi2 protein 07 [Gracilibacillus ureilyticus]|uniref:Prophage pi2 protein 07 n=1 Tax=Gracilibacillus ureilyticus TaxID=531814 RepID=A0A1H9TAY1_9BACI|nr:DUF771 domain-containing protein [Gracilibacillus ureilyticus]SER94382.1 Prophage pi2 protein 07 [Gracilibacillus ureilyticus]